MDPCGLFHGVVSRMLKLKHNTATVALTGLKPEGRSSFLDLRPERGPCVGL